MITDIHEKSFSKYDVLSADAYTKEGIKASGILFDELHSIPDRRLWDALRGAGLSRRQPLTVVTTTAGASKASIAYEVHDYALRVKRGEVDDPTFFTVMYCAEGDDVDSESTWMKANPSLGVTCSLEDFRAIYSEAKNAGPARFASWQRYHLNIWQTSETAWLPIANWTNAGKKPIRAEDLVGRECNIGVDLSSVTDLTSAGLLFGNEDGSYDLLVKHWMPRGRVMEAEQRDKVPYRQWSKVGYLELTEGNAIDQRLIFKRICELNTQYPFINKQVRLDDFNAWTFIQMLQAEGFEPVPVSPKARGISAPAKELLRLVVEEKLHHGDNPLLTWQAGVCSVSEDIDGNIRPVKGSGALRKRIDGILATCYALSGAMLNKADSTKAVNIITTYDNCGLFTL